jgi:bacillithiol biosynthesis deacetylase BshB1
MGSRGTIETRYAEAEAASKIMGIDSRVNLKMADCFFTLDETNKRLIVEQIRRFRPKIVLANAVRDRHPDHGHGATLVSEACFLAGLVKFETTWEGQAQEAWRPKAVYHYIQDEYIHPDFVVDVSAYHSRKIASIQAYATQFYNPDSKEPETPISSKNFLAFISARMTEFGRRIGADYAEGFTVERLPGVEDLTTLR